MTRSHIIHWTNMGKKGEDEPTLTIKGDMFITCTCGYEEVTYGCTHTCSCCKTKWKIHRTIWSHVEEVKSQ
jgi:hypothetical protein